MAKSAFFYTDDYLNYHLSDQHPLQQRRIVMLDRLLAAYGVFGKGEVERIAPTPATEGDIRQCHSEDFVKAVKAASAGERLPDLHRYGLGPGDTPVFPGIWEASLLYAGASLDCAKRVLAGEGKSAFNPSGGLHHAFRNRAAGFCTFNDCAIAAYPFLNAGKRVAYLDIVDAHHGDGVQALFYDDPRVLTISFHETGRTLFPGTGFPEEIGEGEGRGYSINVPLAPYSTDEHYRAAFDEVAAPALAGFDADAIILQVGADAHWEDPLAHLALTSFGWLSLVEKVIALDKPLIALGGGGYNQKTVARLWTLLQAAMAGVLLPDQTPATYSAEWGISHLHDEEKPHLSDADREQAWQYLTAGIEKLRQLGVVGLS
ncbi:MAG TPA: acetoin utilization protein AcuC [Capsulimonadaceae bacterium]|nr:acetoin utilization protein AcuC [Capsulimonadaceae bacterium]